MPIRVGCPGCEASLKMADALAGKAVKCPKCKAILRVPGQAPEEPKVDVLEEVNDEGVQELEEVEAKSEESPRARATVEARDLDIEHDIPEHLRDRILRNLRRDERLIWVGRPTPGLIWLRAVPIVVILLFFLAIFGAIVFFAVLELLGRGAGQEPFPVVVLSAVLFSAFDVYLIFQIVATIWKAIRATLACYVLTDRRAVVWAMPWFGGFKATNYLPADLTEMRRADAGFFGRGTGDLIFHTTRVVTVRRGKYGGVYVTTTHYGFLAIADAPEVEQLVRETLVDPYEEGESD